MKIKLDENIPATLKYLFSKASHSVDTVFDEGMKGALDAEIWPRVCDEGRFFITQDLDFSDVRRFRPGTHTGILLIRLRNASRSSLTSCLLDILRTQQTSE